MPKLALAAAVALAAIGCAFALSRSAPAPALSVELAATLAPSPTPPATIVVDVVGAVARPGVVHLARGARVLDALLAAGGMTAEADLFALNKAAPLRDGDRVYVPRPRELVPPGSAGAEGDERVDINRASPRELEDLPGIGPGIAARIVRAREQQPFAKVEELQTRGLVSARTFADLRELVVVR